MIGVTRHTGAGFAWVERACSTPDSAPTLVFLHGIGSSAESFVDLFDHLPGAYRALAWNAPGYGGSAPLAADWPVAGDYAEALSRFLDAAGVQRAVLIGHSLGTLMAGAFARTSPDRVAHLVLAASACGYRIAPGAALPDGVGARIDDLARLGPTEFARTRAARLVFEPEENTETLARVTREMGRVDPKGYAQAVRMLASGDLEATLREVRVPCDFIIGAEDIVTPEEQTTRAAAARASAGGPAPRVESIARAGHAVYLQRPAAFAEALLRLLPAELTDMETPGSARIGGKDG